MIRIVENYSLQGDEHLAKLVVHEYQKQRLYDALSKKQFVHFFLIQSLSLYIIYTSIHEYIYIYNIYILYILIVPYPTKN